MVHGGPYPATSDARGTSVGTDIDRYLQPCVLPELSTESIAGSLKRQQPVADFKIGPMVMTREAI